MMKIGFLFSGQGAQYPGMMKDIADTNIEAKHIFQLADKKLGRDISGLCFDGPQEALNLTHNTQPCVLAADLAAYYALSSHDIKPDAVAGFSLGEYAALVAAEVIKIEDVFSVVQQRADLMQKAVPVGKGAMAAIMKLTENEVVALCDEIAGYVSPANFNCPGQIVVSGESEAIDKLMELTKARKIRAIRLPVSAPFHCEMMTPAAEKLKIPLTQIQLQDAKLPVYMNVDANPEQDASRILEKIILQTKSPVKWEESIRNMFRDGIRSFIEIGPGKTLSGFVKKTFKNDESIQVFNVTDLETLNDTLDGLCGR